MPCVVREVTLGEEFKGIFYVVFVLVHGRFSGLINRTHQRMVGNAHPTKVHFAMRTLSFGKHLPTIQDSQTQDIQRDQNCGFYDIHPYNFLDRSDNIPLP